MNRKRLKCPKEQKAYRQLWRVVDGAVLDALTMHPDYLTERGARLARQSITKRVTGSVIGFAEQSARGAGLVDNPAADSMDRFDETIHVDGSAQGRRMSPPTSWWGRLFTWSA